MNLQRAAKQAIDLAMFITAEQGLGIPKDSADAFFKLLENKLISNESYLNMKGIVGFRNVAVHQYQRIDYNIVNSVINYKLDDFFRFNKELINSLC